MPEALLLSEKISEVKEEMRRTGLLQKVTPAWVKKFEKRSISTGTNFCEWLQFIYLPNRKIENSFTNQDNAQDYIAPQAIRFFGEDVKRGKLLQLLIELDSLV